MTALEALDRALAAPPRVPLATLPTPLERGPLLPGGARLWVKRHDGPVSSRDLAVSLAVSPDGNAVFVTGISWLDGLLKGMDSSVAMWLSEHFIPMLRLVRSTIFALWLAYSVV